MTQSKIAKVSRLRTSLVITNSHGAAIIYVEQSQGVNVNTGIPIYSRGSLVLSIADGDDPTKEVWCISDTAATSVRVLEGYPPAPA